MHVLALVVAFVMAPAACSVRDRAPYHPQPQSLLTGRSTVSAEAADDSEPQLLMRTAGSAQHYMAMEVAGGVASSIGSLFAGPGAPPVAQVVTTAVKADPEKLVIEAWLEMQVDDVAGTAAAVRTRVEADGGRIVSENVQGALKSAASAAIELRLPPAKQIAFLDWLATQGTIESRRVLASDVSKQLFDQDLALKNLELTMDRLQKLAQRDQPMKELLELEKEMTRVRGAIERLKGEQRFLLDRVAFTTVTLTLTREGGPVEFAPHARLHPGPHLATLTLLDPGTRPRTRVGGGVTIHVQRYLTLDLDAFPEQDGDSRAVVATLGSALYSGLLGGGQRAYLNPYLGVRAGLGYLSGERCGVLGGEVGIELYKQKYIQIEVSLRAMAFFRDDQTDGALHGVFGFEVPF